MLTFASVAANRTIQAVDAENKVVASVANTTGDAADLTLEMPAANVTLSSVATPEEASLEVTAASGGQAAWESTGDLTGVYTAKNGAKFDVSFSAVEGMTGDEIIVKVTPLDTFTGTVKVNGTALNAWGGNMDNRTTKITLANAGVNTVTFSDETTEAYVLTLPTGIGVSGGTAFEGNKYLVAAGSVTLTGLSADYYLLADTAYVKDGNASFTMPSDALEITDTKYYKVTAGTATVNATDADAGTDATATVAVKTPANGYISEEDLTVVLTVTLGTKNLTSDKGGAKAEVAVDGGSGATIESQEPDTATALFEASAAVDTPKDITVVLKDFTASDVTLNVTLSDVTP